MGQQQMLLVALGVIIIAIAIAVGILLFGAASVTTNKDALINDMGNLAGNAYQYKLRLRSMGGGGGSYSGYVIPSKLASNADGTFSITSSAPSSLVLCGTSVQGFGTVTATIDSMGRMGGFTYTGDF
jgi:hypothetical protein